MNKCRFCNDTGMYEERCEYPWGGYDIVTVFCNECPIGIAAYKEMQNYILDPPCLNCVNGLIEVYVGEYDFCSCLKGQYLRRR